MQRIIHTAAYTGTLLYYELFITIAFSSCLDFEVLLFEMNIVPGNAKTTEVKMAKDRWLSKCLKLFIKFIYRIAKMLYVKSR